MDAVVVYESMFGNSERIARAIADGLGEVLPVTVLDVADRGAASDLIRDTSLLVAGGPTHAFGMTRPDTRAEAVERASGYVSRRTYGLREWLAALEPATDARLAATFDTRVSRVRGLPGSAARGAAKGLRRAGFRMLAQPASFYVGGVQGPLADGERSRARAWGRALGEALVPAGSTARP